MMAATDRSISPTKINSAIVSATIAFSEKIAVASDRLNTSRKYGEIHVLTTITAASSTTRIVSHVRTRSISRNGLRSSTV